MEFFQTHELSNWKLWSPLIGGVIIYIGLNIRVVEINEEE